MASPDYPEDPYYHGLSARVPVFGGREKEMRGQGAPTRQAVSQGHWWQDRMYPSGKLFYICLSHSRLAERNDTSLFRCSTGKGASSKTQTRLPNPPNHLPGGLAVIRNLSLVQDTSQTSSPISVPWRRSRHSSQVQV